MSSNINRLISLLNQAKKLGLKEIKILFDTEGRKFDYHYAECDNFHLEMNYLNPEMKGAILVADERSDSPPNYPHDPRLDPGGTWNVDLTGKKSGWGFWNKDFTEWHGPWDSFYDAEKQMKMFDERNP